MRDLRPYEQAFDRAYPDYAAPKYQAVVTLAERLASSDWLSVIESTEVRRFIALLEPVIAIKNYKSQVPFPLDPRIVVRYTIELKRLAAKDSLLLGRCEYIFLALVDQQGFQLPTVSALFHFCHPALFPIVDKNVEAACEILKDECEADFNDIEAPKLPFATTSANNKLKKYRSFIEFLTLIRKFQEQRCQQELSLRAIDKALMVFGDKRLRRQVEERDPVA